MSQAELQGWVSESLNAPEGMGQVPISFVESTATPDRVIFQAVGDLSNFIDNGDNAIGVARWDIYVPGEPMLVQLEYDWLGAHDLINHEAIHAFLWATHSPSGSDSIMEPMEDPGEEGLSATDVAQIRAWLEGAPPLGLAAKNYWHPLDLPHYITRCSLSTQSEALLTVPVWETSPPGAEPGTSLFAVYASDYTQMLSGEWDYLGPVTSLDEEGFASSGWTQIAAEAKTGEVYIGMVIRTALPIASLQLGAAELRSR